MSVTAFSCCFLCHCGHKTGLHPPAPRRIAPVTGVQSEVQCGKISLSWEPVFFDNKAEPLDAPADYLVLRRRGEKIKDPTPITATKTSAPSATATPIQSDQPDTNRSLLAVFKGSDDSTGVSSVTEPQETPLVTGTPTPADDLASETPATPLSDGTLAVTLPEFEFSLIAIIKGTLDSPIGVDMEAARLHFEDTGLPGSTVKSGHTFRKPKGFPPPKSDDDEGLISGYSYYYQIQSMGPDRLTSEVSMTTQIKYVDIPGVPEEVKARQTETGIVLSWDPPLETCSGQLLDPADEPRPGSISGYFVDRADPGSLDVFSTIGTLDSPDMREYTDISCGKDQTYRYRIRTFTITDKIPGLPSDPVTVETTDTFPPAKPVRLSAAFSPVGIHLIWEAGASPDIDGYRIYRREGSDGEYVLQNSTALIKDTGFIDKHVTSGHVYRYHVTAVDNSVAHNESESSDDVKIIVP
jgi:hypothetical protein